MKEVRMKCPNCGFENAIDQENGCCDFCNLRLKIPEVKRKRGMKCPNCGIQNIERSDRCSECSYTISKKISLDFGWLMSDFIACIVIAIILVVIYIIFINHSEAIIEALFG